MYKACSRCGKIHDTKYNCNHNKPKIDYSKYKTDTDRLRNTNKWAEKSRQVREQAQCLCEVCRDKGIYNYNSLEVHHITKLKDDITNLLNDNNLICLCTYHHKMADRGQLSKDYLSALAKKRIEKS